MDIRFWGTRGSLAKPGRNTLRHGGNTSCVEVRGNDGTLIVLESGGKTVVYSVDHEPHAPNPAARAEGEPPRHLEDQRHIAFLADADLVIHDSQYTIAEYSEKTGWGHTPAEWAVDYAVAARAKRLALTHHDPLRDDEALDRIVEMCRRRARVAGSGLEVFAAAA